MSLLSPWTPSTPSFRESVSPSPSVDLSLYTPTIASSPASSPLSSVRFLSVPSFLLPEESFSRFRGRVLQLALDKDGSRSLQRLIGDASSPSLVDLVVSELLVDLPRVMCDTYGNYMCQQLFQVASFSHRLSVWTRLASSASAFVSVATDRRGTHALQALVSRADCSEFRAISECLSPSIVTSLALDQHGTHVLQQIVEVVVSRSPLANLILDEVLDNFKLFATNQFALGLVKRCISLAEVRGFVPKLATKLEQHLALLVEDPFGNYAVQHALEMWSTSATGRPSAKRLVQRISERIVGYSMHKFASNVAEMALKVAEPQMRWKLISQFTTVKGPETETEFFGNLLRSPFAVFVISTALKVTNDSNQAVRLADKFAASLAMPSVAAPINPKTKAKWLKTLAPYSGSATYFLPEVSVPVPQTSSTCWFIPPLPETAVAVNDCGSLLFPSSVLAALDV